MNVTFFFKMLVLYFDGEERGMKTIQKFFSISPIQFNIMKLFSVLRPKCFEDVEFLFAVSILIFEKIHSHESIFFVIRFCKQLFLREVKNSTGKTCIEVFNEENELEKSKYSGKLILLKTFPFLT